MYIVIIKENSDDEQYRNELLFSFKKIEEAIEFMNQILKISNYRVELIPPEE